MDLTQVQKAVEELTSEDRDRFRRWFRKLDAEVWDRQIEKDAKSGKLDFLAEEALAEYEDGKTREL